MLTGAWHERRSQRCRNASGRTQSPHGCLSSAATAGGLMRWASMCRLPAEAARGRTPASSEVNAWVVVKPDDTVIIRIARSEMGQGTLTGLAQLWPKSWSATGSQGDHGIPHARARTWPATGSGATSATGGSRGIRESHDYVRKGGAAARMMLVQAAAARMEGAARPNAAGAKQRHHPHAQRQDAPPTARWPPLQAKLTPPART